MRLNLIPHPALRLTLSALALASLAACAHFDNEAPKAQLLDATAVGLQGQPAPAIAADWWRGFGDAQLNALVEQSLANNPSLRVARARLARVQAAFEGVRGNDLPTIGLGADLTHQRFSNNFIYPPPLGGAILDSGTVQANASWELDFFGKNRSALDAAIGQVRAAEADAQAARMLLASNVARSYFQWVRINAQLAVAERTLAQREQARKLVQDRLSAGLDTQLELQQSESALPDARLQIELLKEQQALTLNALSALSGQQKSPPALVPPATYAIKPVATATAIPLDLLGRRADIAAARWRVEAATQDVSNAKTLFYPNVNLVAFAGFQSIGFDKLLKSGSEQWGVGPAIRLPLFEAGHLRANLRGKSADLDAAIESYNALVIDAVRDVADQLASSQAIVRQQAEQSSAQASAETAYSIALQRYKAGLGTYLNVLSSETSVLAQRRQAVDLAARALDTQVQLIRSLGGGFTPSNTTL
jgi:NodT family efflux transporter outer membrane factor (OMF) lipoprotein